MHFSILKLIFVLLFRSMFHSRALNNKITRLHERCLRVIYNNKNSSFEEPLRKDDSVTIHYRNIQANAVEMYKVGKGYLLK